MVTLREIKKLSSLASPAASELQSQTRHLQDQLNKMTEPANKAFEELTRALGTSINSHVTPALRNLGPSLDVMSGLMKVQQEKARRERETYDHTIKQTAILEQSEELQRRYAAITNKQLDLMAGMLEEAKSTTTYAKAAIYFAALSAMLALMTLLLR
jgi:exonuclease VII large subunit